MRPLVVLVALVALAATCGSAETLPASPSASVSRTPTAVPDDNDGTSVSVGAKPWGIAFDARSRRLYTANEIGRAHV